jgi:hypothetical protein
MESKLGLKTATAHAWNTRQPSPAVVELAEAARAMLAVKDAHETPARAKLRRAVKSYDAEQEKPLCKRRTAPAPNARAREERHR